MRRKVAALLMIAIMTLTACGAVAVTTPQKAAASATQPNPIVVPYKPGAKYVFTPNQFNYDWTDVPSSQLIGTPLHSESAVGGAAFLSVRVSPTQQIASAAFVGILAQLDRDWQTVSTQPCKVTMHLSYDVTTEGDSEAKVQAFNAIGMPFWELRAFGNNPPYLPVMSGKETIMREGNVATFFSALGGAPATFGIRLFAGVPYPYPSQAAGQVSAAAVLDYIIIEFPQVPTTLTLATSNPSPQAGQQFTLSGALTADSGTVTGVATQPVYIQELQGSTWVDIQGPLTTDPNGAFSLAMSLTAPGPHSLRSHYDGNAQYAACDSPALTITVSGGASPSPSPSVSPSPSPSVRPTTSPTATPSIKPSPEFPLAGFGAGVVMCALAGAYLILRRD